MKKKSCARNARSVFSPRLLLSIVLIFVVLGLLSIGSGLGIGRHADAASAQPTPTPNDALPFGSQIGEQAMQQIAALNQEKESRTPAQRKIDSRLLYTMRMARNEPVASGIAQMDTGLAADSKGLIAVDISANVSALLTKRLTAIGAQIIVSFPQYHSITARVPIVEIERIASFPGVRFIVPKQEAETSRGSQAITAGLSVPFYSSDILSTTSRADINARAGNVRRQILSQLALSSTTGPVVSEGDKTHAADAARMVTGADGTGLKIGVLSDGVASLAAKQATGDLPASVTVLAGQAGPATGDEGTAMLEIVHDVAPGAQLYFATAFTSITSFAQNIKDLRTAGCDIIVDDVSYFNETPFQNGQAASVVSPTNMGIVVQAVNDVTVGPQAGALYFSSAANSGNKNDGTSGVWEGDFVNGGASSAPLPAGLTLHDFGGSTFDTLNVNGRPVLKWSDPVGDSANDYDLYVLNAAGTSVVASSTNIQNGTQDPWEDIGAVRNAGEKIVIAQKSGAANRYLHLNTNRGRLAISTSGVIYGHNGGLNTISVAAVPAGPAVFSAPAFGPFPNPFTTSNIVETFSSDGLRRIFYNADGTQITVGDVSSTGGQVLQKPDIAAADGVSTGTAGFSPFFGTSAAAPHAAALAAILKTASPASTNAQIYAAMANNALDIETAGVDRDSGAGIFMPVRSLVAMGLAGPAVLDTGSVSVTEATGNANGRLEAKETASMTVQLNNVGTAGATIVSATLSTATPGVQITDGGVRSYPDIAASTGSPNSAPYFFTLSSTFPCAATIDFALTVTYAGGSTPQTFNFTVATGAPTTVSTTLDATTPPSDPTYVAATGNQTGRLFRNGIASACASGLKTYPGLGATTGSRRYDAYTFTASGTGCTTVTLTTNTNTLFLAGYNSSGFVPSNPGTNYLADAGVSATTSSFSIATVAGQQYTVVVHDINSGGGSGTSYTLNVSGPISGGCQIVTAATVSIGGRVLTSSGRGINGAIVTMTGTSGETRSTRSNMFGFYHFDGVQVGQAYIFGASARGYTFAPQLFAIADETSDLNLIAQ